MISGFGVALAGHRRVLSCLLAGHETIIDSGF